MGADTGEEAEEGPWKGEAAGVARGALSCPPKKEQHLQDPEAPRDRGAPRPGGLSPAGKQAFSQTVGWLPMTGKVAPTGGNSGTECRWAPEPVGAQGRWRVCQMSLG